MRTTYVEIVWLLASAIAVFFCVRNLRIYVGSYRVALTSDPDSLRSAYTNVVTNGLRMLGACCMFAVSCIAAAFPSPLSQGWRYVSQLLLTVIALVLAGVPYLIHMAVRRVHVP